MSCRASIPGPRSCDLTFPPWATWCHLVLTVLCGGMHARRSQSWWHEPQLPGQSRRARVLEAQLKKHAMAGPDVALLESPIDRFYAAEQRHQREVRRAEAHKVELAEREERRERAFAAHQQRVARASLRDARL